MAGLSCIGINPPIRGSIGINPPIRGSIDDGDLYVNNQNVVSIPL